MRTRKLVIKSDKAISSLIANDLRVFLESKDRRFVCTVYKPQDGLMEFTPYHEHECDFALGDVFTADNIVALRMRMGIKVAVVDAD